MEMIIVCLAVSFKIGHAPYAVLLCNNKNVCKKNVKEMARLLTSSGMCKESFIWMSVQSLVSLHLIWYISERGLPFHWKWWLSCHLQPKFIYYLKPRILFIVFYFYNTICDFLDSWVCMYMSSALFGTSNSVSAFFSYHARIHVSWRCTSCIVLCCCMWK